MTIGRHYFTIEYSGGWWGFSKGIELVANYEESHVTILGFSFIKRSVVERGPNVIKIGSRF